MYRPICLSRVSAKQYDGTSKNNMVPVRLSGVNVDGWFVAGATPEWLRGFAGEGDLARLASWRLTHVRIPIDVALLDQPFAWPALDQTVETCGRLGLGCVLALRLSPAEQPALFLEDTRRQQLIERWQALAARYARWNGAVFYDLLDRPQVPGDLPEERLRALGAARLSFAAAQRPQPPGATAGRAWSALALKLTQAIRSVDGQHTIVVQVNGGDPAAFAHLRPTRDERTRYAFACFAPEPFTRQGIDPKTSTESVVYPGVVAGERWDRRRLEQWLQPALDFAARYEASLYVSAFGVSAAAPRASQLTWLRSVLGLWHGHGFGWAYWTYRAFPGAPFGIICDLPLYAHQPQFQNPQRVDYDLLGVLQSEA